MGLCNYSELNERENSGVCLAPISKSPCSTIRPATVSVFRCLSEALLTKEDVIVRDEVVNTFITCTNGTHITYAHKAWMMERADMLIFCP